MKKVLIVFALLAFGFSNAQKGSILVSGTIGFSTGKSTNSFDTSNSEVNSFSIAPKVGYQFSENWTAGIYISLHSSKNDSFNSTENVTNTNKASGYYIGPFLRYTKKLSDLFSVYADLDTGFGSSKVKYSTSQNNNEVTTNFDSFGAGITPAVFVNLKNNFGLNFGIGGISYNTASSKNELSAYESENNGFNFTFGQLLNVGISKNF